MNFNINKAREGLDNLGQQIKERATNFLKERRKDGKNNNQDQGSIRIEALAGLALLAGGISYITPEISQRFNQKQPDKIERQVQPQKPKAIPNITIPDTKREIPKNETSTKIEGKTGKGQEDKLELLKQNIGKEGVKGVIPTTNQVKSEMKIGIPFNSKRQESKTKTEFPIGNSEATERIQKEANIQISKEGDNEVEVNLTTGERKIIKKAKEFNPRGPLYLPDITQEEAEQNLNELNELAERKAKATAAEKANQQKKSK